jgi:SAM-dependent methyltransferase
MQQLQEILDATFKGNGLEFGALHNPVKINNDSKIIYADRLSRADAIKNFPELESHGNNIVESDVLIDLDKNDLSIIKERNIDFIIANHVIEHVVNPIMFLKNMTRNLSKGGRMLLTVPNKDFTHDKNRELTRFRSLFIKFLLRTSDLSDERIEDYLTNKLPVENVPEGTKKFFEENGLPLSYYENNAIPKNENLREKLFEYHRSRSIHVHVWNRESFDFFLRKTIKLLKLNINIEHYLPSEYSHGEMIYILKKLS